MDHKVVFKDYRRNLVISILNISKHNSSNNNNNNNSNNHNYPNLSQLNSQDLPQLHQINLRISKIPLDTSNNRYQFLRLLEEHLDNEEQQRAMKVCSVDKKIFYSQHIFHMISVYFLDEQIFYLTILVLSFCFLSITFRIHT